jgi:hypothetical protein
MTGEEYLIKIQVDIQKDENLTALTAKLEQAARAAGGVNSPMGRMNKSLKKTQIQARSTGRGLQNFSYQMQDIIVQTSGGVDVMRSLSQQLPQMLINMGALGAVIGVVAAGLPLLIQGFSSAEVEVLTLDEAVEKLDASLANIGTMSKDADFKTWIDAWNSATVAVRQTQLALLKFQVVNAQLNIELAESSLKLQAVERDTVGWALRMKGLSASVGGGGIFEWLFSMPDGLSQAIDVLTNAMDSLAVETGVVNEHIQKNAELFGLTAEQYDYYQSIVTKGLDLTQAEIDLLVVWANERKIGNAAWRENIALYIKAGEARKQLAAGEDLVEKAAGGGQLEGGSEDKSAAKTAADEAKRLEEIHKRVYPAAAAYAEVIKETTEEVQAGYRTYEEGQGIIRTALAEYEGVLVYMEGVGETLVNTNNDIAESFSVLDEAADIFASTFETAFDGVAMGTQSVSDAFENMTKSILVQLAKLAATQFIGNMLSGQGGTLGAIGDNLLGNAKGNVFSGGNVIPFAKGGVVSSPTLFPMASGAGLMGESGSEAILPLSRMSNGNLGVEAQAMNVTVNNNAPGVDISTRQTDNGLTVDVVAQTIASAIQRGGNDVANALENTYSLGRGRAVY